MRSIASSRVLMSRVPLGKYHTPRALTHERSPNVVTFEYEIVRFSVIFL